MSPSSGLRESLSTRLAARRVVADMSAKLENTTDEVCVIFHRLGPYHRARLDAAAKRMPIVALELAAESDTYAWSRVEDSPGFRRVTLKPGEGVAAALEKIRPRIVAIPGWARPQAIDALMHCARTKTPSIMMSESQWNDAPRHLLAERVKVELLKACSAAFVGGRTHSEYLRRLGFPSKRIALGYDVVDNDLFTNGAAAARQNAAELRAHLNLPDHYFLCVSRLVPKKNLGVLLRAFANAREHLDPSWGLVLVGDGSEKRALKAMAESMGLTDVVRFPGFRQIEELPAFYGLADAFVLPSVVEPWGLVVNEAMASGLPVLVSRRAGCASELVRPGINGHTFSPRDICGLAANMVTLAHDPELRARMGAASARHIKRFGPDRFAAGLERAVEIAEASPVLVKALNRLAITLIRHVGRPH